MVKDFATSEIIFSFDRMIGIFPKKIDCWN